MATQHQTIAHLSEQLNLYEEHLRVTADWLLTSIRPSGGSNAVVWALGNWGRPYPETTGYIIKTLLDYSNYCGDSKYRENAIKLGEWLLAIQSNHGYWMGGTHPANGDNPSVFNTGQILIGLCALARETGEQRWRDSAAAGAKWLADSLDENHVWNIGNYVEGFNPSYYTRVTWPMLDVCDLVTDDHVRQKAEAVLEKIAERKLENGVISGWGFKPDSAAFTHTIAYTIRGFQESSLLVGDWQRWASVTEPAIEWLLRKAELKSGRLPGEFQEDWTGNDGYVCLTGNVQMAICLMLYYEHQDRDLRILNAAARLIDFVCHTQKLRHPLKRFRGAVAGSYPLTGNYMKLRYPNWSAKFHCDALMLFIRHMRDEGLQ